MPEEGTEPEDPVQVAIEALRGKLDGMQVQVAVQGIVIDVLLAMLPSEVREQVGRQIPRVHANALASDLTDKQIRMVIEHLWGVATPDRNERQT